MADPTPDDSAPVQSAESAGKPAADRFAIFEQVAIERLQAGADATKAASFLPLPVRLTAIVAAAIAGMGVVWTIVARVPVQVNGTAAIVPQAGIASLVAGSSGILAFQVSGLGPNSLSSSQRQRNAELSRFWISEASVTTSNVNDASSLDRLVRAALAPAPGLPLLLPEGLDGTESFDGQQSPPLVSYPAGTLIARIDNPVIHQELNSALLSSLPAVSLQRQKQQERRQRASQLGQLSTLQQEQRNTIAAELSQRRNLYQRYLKLWKQGYLPATKVIEEQSRINNLESQLVAAGGTNLNTGISQGDQLEQAKQASLANLDNRNRLENQLISYLTRTSLIVPEGGFYILSSNFSSGTFVREGDELLSFTRRPPALPAEVPVLLDPRAAQQVHEGMGVLLTPKGISRAEYGGIPGTVTAVDKLPLQGDGLLGVLGSRALTATVQQLLPSPYLVRVRLEQVEARHCRQARSRLCYRWSSNRLPPHPVRLGTLADVQITTTYRRPIEFVMPALRRAFGLVVDNQ